MVAKITLQEFPVMTLGFLRFAIACLLILPFLLTLKKKEVKIKLKHLPILIATGSLLAVINIALFYEGITRTTAISASALTLSIPILSVLGGWWVLKEKIYWINLIGVTLGLAGAVTILGMPVFFLGSANSLNLMGNLLILLSALSFVAGSILSKKILQDYSPIVMTASVFAIAAIIFLIPATLDYINNPSWPSKVSLLGLLGLLYIIILSSISAYFLLIWGLNKISVVHANLFQYIEPAVAATIAVPILGERISFSFIIGTCLVVLGVYWGTLGKQEHHHAHHKSHRL